MRRCFFGEGRGGTTICDVQNDASAAVNAVASFFAPRFANTPHASRAPPAAPRDTPGTSTRGLPRPRSLPRAGRSTWAATRACPATRSFRQLGTGRGRGQRRWGDGRRGSSRSFTRGGGARGRGRRGLCTTFDFWGWLGFWGLYSRVFSEETDRGTGTWGGKLEVKKKRKKKRGNV